MKKSKNNRNKRGRKPKNGGTYPQRRNRMNNRTGMRRNNAPVVRGFRTVNQTKNSIRIRRTEPMMDLEGTALFRYHHWHINPGRSKRFPWLSKVANNYETYKYNSLKFMYIPSCPTSTTGRIDMAIDYDAQDDNSSLSTIQILQFAGATSGPLWDRLTVQANMSSMNTKSKFFTRDLSVPTGMDTKTYDCCQLVVSTIGGPDSITGMLWVEYDVTLYTPQVMSTFPTSTQTATPNTANTTPFDGITNELLEKLAVKITKGSSTTLNIEEPITGILRLLQEVTSDQTLGNIATPTVTGTTSSDTVTFMKYLYNSGKKVGVDCFLDLHNATEAAPIVLTWNGTAGAGTTDQVSCSAVSYAEDEWQRAYNAALFA